ncbi:hypothetical protein [Bacillus rhizoplanae]|uniref:hypothetical protein n=1 Tax=Bacillus rhizoplanae TaxID=2880966 RepID=UPI003D1BBC7D
MKKITTEDFSSSENMKDVVGFYKKLTEQQEPLIRLDDCLACDSPRGYSSYSQRSSVY